MFACDSVLFADVLPAPQFSYVHVELQVLLVVAKSQFFAARLVLYRVVISHTELHVSSHRVVAEASLMHCDHFPQLHSV